MSAQSWFYRESHISTSHFHRWMHPLSAIPALLEGPPGARREAAAALAEAEAVEASGSRALHS